MKNYPLNKTVDYVNVRELVEGSAKLYGDKIAYSYRASGSDKKAYKVSFNQLRDDVQAIVTAFHANGIAASTLPL